MVRWRADFALLQKFCKDSGDGTPTHQPEDGPLERSLPTVPPAGTCRFGLMGRELLQIVDSRHRGGLVLDRLVGKLTGSHEFSERWEYWMARMKASHSSTAARFEDLVVTQKASITLTMKTIYDVLRKKESELERVRGEIEALRLVIPVLIDEGIVSEDELKQSDDEHEESESEQRATVR